ncbi:hypothetical protein HD554DRAFT_2022923, partial [Boletus coccyginus]
RYRHAAPSAPWPWMDFDADVSEVCPLPPGELGQDPEWSRYPQSLFGNWTHDQVERCGILKPAHHETCSVHKVDIFTDGSFDRNDEGRTFKVENPRAYWKCLETPPPSNIRVRAVFVDSMTVPVLQILGTKYNVEPFFFASSANWIPSRYQEDPKSNEDHITVVLPFIRTMKKQRPITRTRPVRTANFPINQLGDQEDDLSLPYQGTSSSDENQIIDTQAPLLLPDGKLLLQDLLAIHMYRTPTTSTIISYHPTSELQRTSAKRLQSLAQRTGDSVYWSKIFATSKDPTFFFLAILWYALYEWDEAFEVLYRYINTLESEVLKDNNLSLTRELHKLQAHLLYYQQLLRDFRVSVEFVRDTPNPAMSVLASTPEERGASADLLRKESNNLISEIDRLTGQRLMLSERLQNIIHLAFASVNIEDAKATQELAKTTMVDSAAMKQISYLTMIFLPASFLANVFSMNVREMNQGTTETLARYVEVTIGLTVLTSWLAIALQKESTFHVQNSNNWERVLWPVFYAYNVISTAIKKWFEPTGRLDRLMGMPGPQFIIVPQSRNIHVHITHQSRCDHRHSPIISGQLEDLSCLTRTSLYEEVPSEVSVIPAPVICRYRHATPSAPWPWMNFDIDDSEVQPAPPGLPDDYEWSQYPHNLFRNWTCDQVNRSQMLTKCNNCELSTVYKIGLFNDGSFDNQVETRTVRKDDAADWQAYWDHLKAPPPSGFRVQALFIEEMTLPVLQMLGTRYNVEPFFFASSANWIPSRYQEDPGMLEDHITVVLPFIRVLKNQRPITRTRPMSILTLESGKTNDRYPSTAFSSRQVYPFIRVEQIPIPTCTKENKIVLQDLLSLHMVRNSTTSTIISYHPSMQGTSAKHLQCLASRTGDSIYWSNIFKRSRDPTFLFLAILWYALYAWDEAFEILFRYINTLEYRVLQSNNIKLTRELHELQAHLLYYQQLLRDFLRSVEFVRDTPNPAMSTPSISKAEREDSAKLLRTEAYNLTSEIERLTRQREMLSDRLDNAIHLAFATVSLNDSRDMQRLAEVTRGDVSAMKQMAYLSMTFLPATYLANVFSMNVREMHDSTNETLAKYIGAAVSLTLLTSWLAITLQKDSFFYPSNSGVLRRTLWPLFYVHGVISTNIRGWRRPADHRSPRDNRPSSA